MSVDIERTLIHRRQWDAITEVEIPAGSLEIFAQDDGGLMIVEQSDGKELEVHVLDRRAVTAIRAAPQNLFGAR